MSVKVVIISGRRGSGKTSTMEAVYKQIQAIKGNRPENIIFAGSIYQMHDYCRNILLEAGILTPEQLKTKDRDLLLFLGTKWGRDSIDKDVWVKLAKHKAKVFTEKQGSLYENIIFIVSDCRFENELNAFPEALRIRLECNREIRKIRCESFTETVESEFHPSETGLDQTMFDGKFDIVFNSGKHSINHISDLIMAQILKGGWEEKRGVKKLIEDDHEWALDNLNLLGYNKEFIYPENLGGLGT